MGRWEELETQLTARTDLLQQLAEEFAKHTNATFVQVKAANTTVIEFPFTHNIVLLDRLEILRT